VAADVDARAEPAGGVADVVWAGLVVEVSAASGGGAQRGGQRLVRGLQLVERAPAVGAVDVDDDQRPAGDAEVGAGL